MAAPPADLSICDQCRRPVPPSNHPQFARWKVVKNDAARVAGMRCPDCMAKAESA